MKRIGRSINIHFMTSIIYLVETHVLVVGKRKDGTEYIVRRTPQGRSKRFTLDDHSNIFFTAPERK